MMLHNDQECSGDLSFFKFQIKDCCTTQFQADSTQLSLWNRVFISQCGLTWTIDQSLSDDVTSVNESKTNPQIFRNIDTHHQKDTVIQCSATQFCKLLWMSIYCDYLLLM